MSVRLELTPTAPQGAVKPAIQSARAVVGRLLDIAMLAKSWLLMASVRGHVPPGFMPMLRLVCVISAITNALTTVTTLDPKSVCRIRIRVYYAVISVMTAHVLRFAKRISMIEMAYASTVMPSVWVDALGKAQPTAPNVVM